MTERWGDLPEGWYQPPPAAGREPWEEPVDAPDQPPGLPARPDFGHKLRALIPGEERLNAFGLVWAWVESGRPPRRYYRWEKCLVTWVVEDEHGWWLKVDWDGYSALVHESATTESVPAPGAYF